MFKIISKGILALLLLYSLYGITLFFYQDSLIYQPSNIDFMLCEEFKEEQKIQTELYRFYYNKASDMDLIVIYHGNTGSACNRASLSNHFSELGFSTIIFEYSGYSGDNLKPTRKRIENSINEFDLFVQELDYKNKNIMGISIGTYFASYHLTKSDFNSVVYINGFTDLADVVQSKLPIYPIKLLLREDFNQNNLEDLKTRKALFLHAQNDRVIPLKFGIDFYNQSLIENKELIIINNTGHNNIFINPQTSYEIVNFFTQD